MTQIQMGICIGDACYAQRFENYLMAHYSGQLKIHTFSSCEVLLGDIPDRFDVLVAADHPEKQEELSQAMQKRGTRLIWLTDEEKAVEPGWAAEKSNDAGYPGSSGEVRENDQSGPRILYQEKYQDMDQLMKVILQEKNLIRKDHRKCFSFGKDTELTAVYSLTDGEYQLPYAAAMGEILGERYKVLLWDLQENSGLRQMFECPEGQGLEELLVMAGGGRFSPGRMQNCIGHAQNMDYIYPADCSESLWEAGADHYLRLLQMIRKELDYDIVILNLGGRFPGFFRLLDQCREIHLVSAAGSPAAWRYKDFQRELEKCAGENTAGRIRRMEIRPAGNADADALQLAEAWRRSDVGLQIRESMPEVTEADED